MKISSSRTVDEEEEGTHPDGDVQLGKLNPGCFWRLLSPNERRERGLDLTLIQRNDEEERDDGGSTNEHKVEGVRTRNRGNRGKRDKTERLLQDAGARATPRAGSNGGSPVVSFDICATLFTIA
ncbi:hypothetical protein K0M31_009506 [Melipona bicolor]|uniref:Uncharacterized protein n=1 Tax=Melipona bicolor TaxID=60889 RepID=A0AA40KJ32_9HYME|nr:hypothetical protein K0M31_009506 [Melipona bicolor]